MSEEFLVGEGWQDLELEVELTREEARRGRWFCAVVRMGWTGGIVGFLVLLMGAMGYVGVSIVRMMGIIDGPMVEGELGERAMHVAWATGLLGVMVLVGVNAVVWRCRRMVGERVSYRVGVTNDGVVLRWEDGGKEIPWRFFTAFEETGDLWVVTTQREYLVIPARVVRREDLLRLRIFLGWKTGIERPEVAHGFPVEIPSKGRRG